MPDWDREDPDDFDALFDAFMDQTDDVSRRVAEWETWRERLADDVARFQADGGLNRPGSRTHRPPWHDHAGVRGPREYGWFGDREWAETWWPDPKYL